MSEPDVDRGQAFSTLVRSPQWWDEATTWILETLGESGHTVTGPIERAKVRPWAVHVTVATHRGRVWFKANTPSMAFEPSLRVELARLIPDSVAAPLAIDAGRGWMLTDDHGPSLYDEAPDSGALVRDWIETVREAARIQRRLVGHGNVLLATGLPNCSPERTLDHLDVLLDVVDDELATMVEARRPQIEDACARLAESPFPVTWQHGDLHPGNVARVDERIRIFDFGDSQWASAPEVLAVPYGIVDVAMDVRWEDLLDAYCTEWGASSRDFGEAWNATAFTQPIHRALTWHRALRGASEDDLRRWGDAPTQHLSRVLDA